MTPETIQAIQAALAPVAEKVGQGAQFGWEVVVRQQYVSAVGALMASAAAFVVLCLSLFGMYHAVKHDQKDGVVIILFVIISSLSFLATFLYDGVAHLINPDYYALEFFINLAK